MASFSELQSHFNRRVSSLNTVWAGGLQAKPQPLKTFDKTTYSKHHSDETYSLFVTHGGECEDRADRVNGKRESLVKVEVKLIQYSE